MSSVVFEPKFRRHKSSGILVPLLVSLLLSGYYATFGSIEPEESIHVAFSIAAGTSSNGPFDAPRSVGTYSLAGVPLYDGLHGCWCETSLQRCLVQLS